MTAPPRPAPSSIQRRMDACIESARSSFATLRTGRATTALVERVLVHAYGSSMLLPQVAQVGVQQPRSIVITPHDPSLVPAIDRALRDSDIGATPAVDGLRLRLELPQLTAEVRVGEVRRAGEMAEAARVAVRSVRREAINDLRRRRKAEEISEAKLNGRSKDIQAATDAAIDAIDALLEAAMQSVSGM